MSAKQCHRLRQLQRENDYQKILFAWPERNPHLHRLRQKYAYENAHAEWLERKPSAIHFIQRIIWKRREPRRADF